MNTSKHAQILIWLGVSVLLVACGRGQTRIVPPEIRYGETECVQCRMIISDARFTAGYTYEPSAGRYESAPFDDIGDMLIYADKHPEHDIVAYWVHDFDTEEWLDAQDAYFVFSQQLDTPMAQGTAAAHSNAKAEELAAEYQGQVSDWEGLLARHRAGELVVALVGEAAMGGEAMLSNDHGAMHTHEDEALITLDEADATGYHLTLLAHGPIQTGYNSLMLQLTNLNGETVTQADVTFHPFMHMPQMTHAAPVEQPDSDAHLKTHFSGAVGFPMPSGPDLGAWELGVTFSDPVAGIEGEATFPIEVAPSRLSGSFIAADDESKIFLMIVSPEAPSVGVQPFEVLVVRKESAMAWPPMDGLTLGINPEMPTMGHGSPDNENPVSVGDGHYRGRVNFTMAGPWTVSVSVRRGGEKIGEVVVDFDVQ